MAANRERRTDALSWYMEKQTISSSSVEKAAEALTDLLESATHYLDQEVLDENAPPGNRREILSYMVEFLTAEAESNTLGIPEIIDAERDPQTKKQFIEMNLMVFHKKCVRSFIMSTNK